MNLTDLFNFSLWAVLIEFIGALIIIGSLLASLVIIVQTRNVERGRYLVTAGVLAGLSFKVAGTLLRTIQLQTWHQILMFIAILALRTVLKRFFVWEQGRLKQIQNEETK